MIVVPLLLNAGVLVAVLIGFVARASWIERACGPRTPARDILVAVYGSILFASGFLLGVLTAGAQLAADGWLAPAAAALLAVQVLYKLVTVASVRAGLRNPVVASNLGIAAVHAITLVTLAPALT